MKYLWFFLAIVAMTVTTVVLTRGAEADEQRAEGGPADDEQLDGLYEHQECPPLQEKPADNTYQHYHSTDDREQRPLSACARVVNARTRQEIDRSPWG